MTNASVRPSVRHTRRMTVVVDWPESPRFPLRAARRPISARLETQRTGKNSLSLALLFLSLLLFGFGELSRVTGGSRSRSSLWIVKEIVSEWVSESTTWSAGRRWWTPGRFDRRRSAFLIRLDRVCMYSVHRVRVGRKSAACTDNYGQLVVTSLG